MSAKGPVQVKAPPVAKNLTPVRSHILMRNCACGTCESCEKDREKPGQLQRSATAPVPASVPSSVYSVLNSPGQPLPSGTRSFMEPRFGRDFSGVRVHND